MTKLRTPDSLEDACHMAAGYLGVQVISEALTSIGLSASPSLIVKWGDPDAVQTPNFRQVRAMETLLLKAGFPPVFGALLMPELLAPVATAVAVNPIEAAMQHTIESAELLKTVRAAARDGRLTAGEIATLKPKVSRLQKALAELNRSLVVRAKS